MAFVPLGTPLLAGPGAIVATMLFVQRIHNGAQAAGFAVALGAVIVILWLAMRFCGVVKRILRDAGVQLLTRISGLLLSALAAGWWRSRSGRSWRTAERDQGWTGPNPGERKLAWRRG